MNDTTNLENEIRRLLEVNNIVIEDKEKEESCVKQIAEMYEESWNVGLECNLIDIVQLLRPTFKSEEERRKALFKMFRSLK